MEHGGHDGGGYFNGENAVNKGFSLSINANTAGAYEVEVRYANGGTGNRGADISHINQDNTHLEFAPTNGWDMWQSTTQTLQLVQGDNLLNFNSTGAEGMANIDSITFFGDGLSMGQCPPPPVDLSYLIGMDISSIPELRDFNVWFVDTDGVGGKDMLEILKNHSVNAIRLRTFVDPWAQFGYAAADDVCAGRAEPYNDKDHIVAFAQEIKQAGFALLLDLQYSDSWTDADSQVIPEAWRGITTVSGMADQVRSYTQDIISALEQAGARPDIVQIGNEITGGMLSHLPTSESNCWGENLTTSPIAGDYNNWDNLATYLKAGIEGVKAVNSDIQIMMHIENSDSVSGMQWWVDNAQSRGVVFDILGLSVYEPFQGPSTEWNTIMQTMAANYPNLKFIFAEYNQEITLVNEVMKGLPNNRGMGAFFWEPTQSGYWGDGIFTWDGNTATADSAKFSELDNFAAKYGL